MTRATVLTHTQTQLYMLQLVPSMQFVPTAVEEQVVASCAHTNLTHPCKLSHCGRSKGRCQIPPVQACFQKLIKRYYPLTHVPLPTFVPLLFNIYPIEPRAVGLLIPKSPNYKLRFSSGSKQIQVLDRPSSVHC